MSSGIPSGISPKILSGILTGIPPVPVLYSFLLEILLEILTGFPLETSHGILSKIPPGVPSRIFFGTFCELFPKLLKAFLRDSSWVFSQDFFRYFSQGFFVDVALVSFRHVYNDFSEFLLRLLSESTQDFFRFMSRMILENLSGISPGLFLYFLPRFSSYSYRDFFIDFWQVLFFLKLPNEIQ